MVRAATIGSDRVLVGPHVSHDALLAEPDVVVVVTAWPVGAIGHPHRSSNPSIRPTKYHVPPICSNAPPPESPEVTWAS